MKHVDSFLLEYNAASVSLCGFKGLLRLHFQGSRGIQPIPVAARSRARVCGGALAGIVVSNPAGGMDVYIFESCMSKLRSLQRPDPSSRGVLATVVCHCV